MNEIGRPKVPFVYVREKISDKASIKAKFSAAVVFAANLISDSDVHRFDIDDIKYVVRARPTPGRTEFALAVGWL
jgi:hypothetical protein